MNSEWNNYEYLSQIENINLTNQLSSFEKSEFSNNYISNKNQMSYINNYLTKNSPLKQNKLNEIMNSNIKNRNNIITKEIKNIDYNEEYFKSYNFTPNNFNFDNSKNSNENRINNNDLNSKKSLYDFIFPQKKCQKIVKLINLNQKNSQSFLGKNPSRNSLYINSLLDNQNIYPSNENLNGQGKKNEIHIKKQIINITKNNPYKNINQVELLNYKTPTIPLKDTVDNKNYFFSDKKFVKKNRINLIPVPIKNKLKLSSDNDYKSNKKNINIDINLDCDKINNRNGYHKKVKSSFIGDYDLNNNNDISQNEKREKSQNCHYLKRDKSEKILNSKVKYKKLNINNIYTNKWSDFNDNNKSNHKYKSCAKIKSEKNLYRKEHNIENKIKIIWGGKSQAGKNSEGKIKINQDSFKVCENINNINNFNIFILCDGHGNDGHHVSQYVSEIIISRISNHHLISSLKDLDQIYEALTDNNYNIIKNIFFETDIYLSNQQKFDTYTSGTTCILILQIGKNIISANSGDSRAILIYSLNENNFNNRLYNTKIFPLSLDSKPDLPSEEERIINSGGEVHRGKNRKGKYSGPMRVFAKGKDYPGLAMSRSLGDFRSKQYGVICEPSFVKYYLNEYSKYIVICSDGVWDFMDNESVMKIGNKHYLNNNPEGFCQEILGNASYWWEKEDIVIDDITALIIFFKFEY